jgi:SAM-dependent methyltransferase
MISGPIPSPNIWNWPEVYEAENHAQDPDGLIWAALRREAPWAGLDVLDLGCGDGFHLPVFAADARSVVGVEPHVPLVERAHARGEGRVLPGRAERLPLPDSSVDVVHARTAYFFGAGCEPGLAETDRVLRPGGVLAVVDVDATRGPYGEWMRADIPRYDPVAAERFFARRGFSTTRIATDWRFPDRATLEAVLRIEFTRRTADRAVAAVTGLALPVHYRLHVRRTGLVSPG